jgi:hypothetical protein
MVTKNVLAGVIASIKTVELLNEENERSVL